MTDTPEIANQSPGVRPDEFAESMDHPTGRRRFIRTTGGGMVFAALPVALPLTGCSGITDIPDTAVAAWQPTVKESDVRRWALSYAILAPNPHNRQPWLVDLSNADEIVLRIDTARLLPQTDPWGRQILIGTGAMLALLEIAAAKIGYAAQIRLFEDQPYGQQIDDRPLARIRFTKLSAQTAKPDADMLFEQIVKRRTVRGLYDPTRAPDAGFVTSLKHEQQAKVLAMGLVSRTSESAKANAIADLTKAAWKIELTTPHTMMESIELLRVGAAEIDKHRDGISLTDPMLVMIAKLGLFDRSKPPAADSSVTRKQIDNFNAGIESTPAFYWLASDNNKREDQIEVGIAYARAQLRASAFGLVMHPLSQGLQEYTEMVATRRALHQVMGFGDGTAGATVQMLCRVGYLPPDSSMPGPAPRRGLNAHIQA